MENLFETERLEVRQLELRDAEFILALLNTPSWLRYIGDRNVHCLDDARAYLVEGPIRSYSENGYGAWMVSLSGSQQPVGMCGLLKRPFLRFPDVGFALLPDFEGQGLGSEALMGVLSYSKEKLGILDLFAFTDPDNQRSIRLLERSGFRYQELFTPPGEKMPLKLFSVFLNEVLI